MQTSENIILDAINNNWLNALAFYYKAKTIYVNSCFYNYSIRSLSEKTGFSFNAIKGYIETLQRKKLIKIHSGNLIFVSQSVARKLFNHKPKDKHLCTIKHFKTLSIYEIKKLLQC